ncbi:MAG TPA: P-loop NTPase [Polyangia bacterium]|nr:P-loop NTPase [Polyangia bacterium]
MKSPSPSSATKRIITVGGGKGGVGKSIVSSNLAAALALRGSRVVIVDCDLGAANQHVLFGIDRPLPGIQALIEHKIDSLEDALTPTPLPNLHLVAGSGAAVGAANITHGEKQRIMKRIRALKADVIIVDVGAGVSFNVLDFFELGSQRLLVITPQVTSIQTAYSFLKGAVLRTLRHHAEKSSELALLEPAISSKENEKVSHLLARLREENPVFGEAVFKILNRFGAQIVGNQVSEPNQAGIFHAVSRMIHDFLGITVPILGFVGISRRVRESINQRRPMMLGNQIDENTKVFQQMAEALLLEDVSLDDLLIEEEDEEPAQTASGSASAKARPAPAPPIAAAPADLEMTPAPRHPADSLAATTRVEQATAPASGAAPASVSGAAPASGAAPTPAEGVSGPLPETPEIDRDLESYARKHHRYGVDWLATLRNDDLVAAVRIFDISAASVAAECSEAFEVGQVLALVFDQLPQRDTVAATVLRRIPRGLVLEADIPDTVIAAAAAIQPAPASRLAG